MSASLSPGNPDPSPSLGQCPAERGPEVHVTAYHLGSVNMLVHEQKALIPPEGDIPGFTAAIEPGPEDPDLASP